MAGVGSQLPSAGYVGQCTAPVRAVVDAAYCTPCEVTLTASERRSLSGDDFTVKGEDGRVWFRVDAKTFSMSEKRVVTDAIGKPACTLKKKLIALKPTWQLYRDTEFTQELAIIKPKTLTMKPTVNVYLSADGDKEADFCCKGNFRAKTFEVYDLRGGQTVIAQIKKESRFSGMKAFVKSQISDKDTYFITAQPGADLAFLSALCMAVDEIYQDQPE